MDFDEDNFALRQGRWSLFLRIVFSFSPDIVNARNRRLCVMPNEAPVAFRFLPGQKQYASVLAIPQSCPSSISSMNHVPLPSHENQYTLLTYGRL